MTDYFKSNLTGMFSVSSSNIADFTTAAFYNGLYVQSAIGVPGTQNITAILENGPVTSLWGRHDIYTPNLVNNSGQTVMEFVNSTGIVVARLVNATIGNAYQFQYWNGAAFVSAGANPALPLITSLQSIQYNIVCGVSGSFTLYQNGGIPIISVIGLNAAVNNIAYVRLWCYGSSTNALCYFSQVLFTDIDTRDLNITSDVANAAGAVNDGTGTYTDCNSRNLTRSRVLPVVGNIFTMTKAARTFPGTKIIKSVGINGALRVNGGVINNARPVLRIGGVNYVPALVPSPNGGYENRWGDWATNPAGSGLITPAVYNGAEFGWEARG